MKLAISLCSLGLATLLFVGCGKDGASAPVAKSDVLVTTEPQGAVGVGEARKTAKDGGEIVLVGRIGGSDKPFVSGMAAFTIVDPKIAPCGAAEGCPTPWDYCCEPNTVKENIATIKVNDASGKPVMTGANDLLGVKELATVVVKGTAKTGEDGSLSVTAKQIFVRN
ncbi:MAG: hypothetical protein J0M17_04545 [Planctomycetes bacterium]|nr:hypothetical protein [Planctomycetota bacterium]